MQALDVTAGHSMTLQCTPLTVSPSILSSSPALPACIHLLNSEDGIGQGMQALVTAGNVLRQSSDALRVGGFDAVHVDGDNCVLGFWRKV